MDFNDVRRIRPDDCAWTVGDGFLQVVLAKAKKENLRRDAAWNSAGDK